MRHPLMKMALLFLAVALLAGAGDDARFRSLGHRLMCVCGCNQVLLECNHVGCQYSDGMRAELMNAVDRGDSDDLTLQAFVQKYGATVLLAPTTTGFNRVAWIMPFAVLAAGLGAVCLIVKAWNKRPPSGGTGSSSAGGSSSPNDGLDRFRDQARKETEL